jgi:predicted phage terminase large subunit-like protein
MWSLEALAKRKAELDAQDVLAWSQEFLNEPRPSDTQMFYCEQWPTYSKAPYGLTIFQFWDLAISERTTADYTVGWTIGVDEDNNVYLLERRRGRLDFNRTLSEIGQMGAAWPTVTMIGIEQVAYQAAAVQEALRRTLLPVVPVVPDKDKITRARLLEARAAGKKVFRPVEASWWAEFAAEANVFPYGAHDDQVDALAGALRMAGWSADSVSWSYGVWTCQNQDCKHMFVFEAGRACPKCGTKAPDTYENPELLAMGGLLEESREV